MPPSAKWFIASVISSRTTLYSPVASREGSSADMIFLRKVNSSVVEPYPLEFFTHEPHADDSGNFIVVEDIRIHGIDRHGRPIRFRTTGSPGLNGGIVKPAI